MLLIGEGPIITGENVYTLKTRDAQEKSGVLSKKRTKTESYWEDQNGKEIHETTVRSNVAYDTNSRYQGSDPPPLESIVPDASTLPKEVGVIIAGTKTYRQESRIPLDWDTDKHGVAHPYKDTEKFWVAGDGEEVSVAEMDKRIKENDNSRYVYRRQPIII